tara:strand:+ start:56 stop:232 length:177 start_codon:yes stop_codon:yes gene_type:complete
MNRFQKKREKQYRDSEKFTFYGFLGIVLITILLTLFGGCAATQETTKECCKSQKTSTK